MSTFSAEPTSREERRRRTEGCILQEARRLFAEEGFERATIRAVARRTGVDPALVMQYFGSKEGLFASATAFDLQLPELTQVARHRIGATLVAHFLDVWEGSRSNGSLISLLRAAASSDDAANAIRTIFGGQVVPMLARVVPPDELFQRAALVATQIMGLAVTRYILKVPPVVAMDRAQLVNLLGPTMQRYVVGKL